jgi:hypothetical protein
MEKILNQQIEKILIDTLHQIKLTSIIEPNSKNELNLYLDNLKKDIKNLNIEISTVLEDELKFLEEILRKL